MPLSDLLEMLLGFNFLILGVHQTLGMHQLHLDGLEMLLQNLQALLMLFNF